MDSIEKKENLFAEFPPVRTPDWEQKINDDPKGADYTQKLVSKTKEGFSVKPYYREEDLEELQYLDIYPGSFPFVRGNTESGNHWYIRQDLPVKDLKKANLKRRRFTGLLT